MASPSFFDQTGNQELPGLSFMLTETEPPTEPQQEYDCLSAGKPAQGLAQQFIRTHHNLLLPGVGVNVKYIAQTLLDGAYG